MTSGLYSKITGLLKNFENTNIDMLNNPATIKHLVNNFFNYHDLLLSSLNFVFIVNSNLKPLILII
jgi:hypothetical protein